MQNNLQFQNHKKILRVKKKNTQNMDNFHGSWKPLNKKCVPEFLLEEDYFCAMNLDADEMHWIVWHTLDAYNLESFSNQQSDHFVLWSEFEVKHQATWLLECLQEMLLSHKTETKF